MEMLTNNYFHKILKNSTKLYTLKDQIEKLKN